MKSHLTETLEKLFWQQQLHFYTCSTRCPNAGEDGWCVDWNKPATEVSSEYCRHHRQVTPRARHSRLVTTAIWGIEKQVECAGGRDHSTGWQELAYTGEMKDAQGKLPFVSHCVSIWGTLLFRNISTHTKIDFEKLRTADYVISPKKHFTLVENYFCWLM